MLLNKQDPQRTVVHVSLTKEMQVKLTGFLGNVMLEFLSTPRGTTVFLISAGVALLLVSAGYAWKASVEDDTVSPLPALGAFGATVLFGLAGYLHAIALYPTASASRLAEVVLYSGFGYAVVLGGLVTLLAALAIVATRAHNWVNVAYDRMMTARAASAAHGPRGIDLGVLSPA